MKANYLLQEMKSFPVSFGELELFLSGFQLSGSASLKETGAANGETILSGFWKKGTRLKLTGNLPPDLQTEKLIQALNNYMLEKTNFTLGKLTFPNAMLCSYLLTDGQDIPEIQLIFYCPEKPVLLEEVS